MPCGRIPSKGVHYCETVWGEAGHNYTCGTDSNAGGVSHCETVWGEADHEGRVGGLHLDVFTL